MTEEAVGISRVRRGAAGGGRWSPKGVDEGPKSDGWEGGESAAELAKERRERGKSREEEERNPGMDSHSRDVKK